MKIRVKAKCDFIDIKEYFDDIEKAKALSKKLKKLKDSIQDRKDHLKSRLSDTWMAGDTIVYDDCSLKLGKPKKEDKFDLQELLRDKPMILNDLKQKYPEYRYWQYRQQALYAHYQPAKDNVQYAEYYNEDYEEIDENGKLIDEYYEEIEEIDEKGENTDGN